MKFKGGEPLYSYEVQREGGEDVLYVNYLGAPYVPDIAGSSEIMERSINVLIENPNVSRIVFVQQKNYNYDFKETSLLIEIAQLYVYLIKQENILSQRKIGSANLEDFSKRYRDLVSFLFLLKKDPIGAYFELKRIVVEERIFLNKLTEFEKGGQRNYLAFLEKILD